MHPDKFVYLSFLLGSKLCAILAPLAALSLSGSLSDCPPRAVRYESLFSTSSWNLCLSRYSAFLSFPTTLNQQSTMQCSFMLPEQISRARCSSVPGLHSLPALFLFLPPVSWDGVRTWAPLGYSFGTLPCSMRSALFSRCMQSGAAFFPVAFSGLVVLIIFWYYMWF